MRLLLAASGFAVAMAACYPPEQPPVPPKPTNPTNARAVAFHRAAVVDMSIISEGGRTFDAAFDFDAGLHVP
jgi:hypothetical protein